MKLTLILSALLCFFNSFISSQTKDSIKTKEIENQEEISQDFSKQFHILIADDNLVNMALNQ